MQSIRGTGRGRTRDTRAVVRAPPPRSWPGDGAQLPGAARACAARGHHQPEGRSRRQPQQQPTSPQQHFYTDKWEPLIYLKWDYEWDNWKWNCSSPLDIQNFVLVSQYNWASPVHPLNYVHGTQLKEMCDTRVWGFPRYFMFIHCLSRYIIVDTASTVVKDSKWIFISILWWLIQKKVSSKIKYVPWQRIFQFPSLQCVIMKPQKTFWQTKLNIRRYFDDDKNSLKMRSVSRACPHTRGGLLYPIQNETN